MQTSNQQTFTQEELKKYLTDYIVMFLRILRAAVYTDMKKLGIDNLESYLSFLLLEYYVQKKRGKSNESNF
jgi:hypothetical protein